MNWGGGGKAKRYSALYDEEEGGDSNKKYIKLFTLFKILHKNS